MIRNSNRFPIRPSVAAVWLLALTFFAVDAGAREWTTPDSDDPIEGELSEFDFSTKEVFLEDREGDEHRLAAKDLDLGGKFQVLLSPEFLRSYPDEEWTSEHGWFLFLAIAVPAFFLLVSFYLCAAILLKNFNPLKGAAGWIGSVILGGLLVAFYVYLSGRSPGAAIGVAIFGGVMVSILLSLYVSIIYNTTTLNGLKVLALHFFGALVLIMITVLVVKFTCEPQSVEDYLDRQVFVPVGLLGGN